MQIGENKVVSIHYTLTDNEQNVLDTSSGGSPLYYIHGIGALIVGMEEGLLGKTAGTKLMLKVAPEKGYGAYEPELVQHVPLTAFGAQEVKPGMQFDAGSDEQRFIVTVKEVGAEVVIIDGNHPLAGVELNFEIEIMAVRNASEEELAHGHVHGLNGHHH
ncbi:MAG: peptidylprolyl isomerase [bacterium]|nr:peptidylprolyl isomerase [bacterium]